MTWIVASLLGPLSGCSEDPPPEACEPRTVYRSVGYYDSSAVDLLFVIDNSASMASAQGALAEQLPFMMRAFTTGDLDGDGREDFLPVRNLQVGVISTDMGALGFDVPSCGAREFGDDGLLRTTGDPSVTGCGSTYPPFLGFRAPGDDAVALGVDLACLARIGTLGCEIEQPMEATLKALYGSPSYLEFYGGTFGHGDGANAGFRRSSAVTAIVVLTDDDDCSVMDPELLDASSSSYTGDLKTRCSAYPEALQPITRYVQGLIDAAPRQLIYAPIIGVPERLLSDPGAPNFTAILADPTMQVVYDPSDPAGRSPSCVSPDGARAFPPRRHVELAQQLAAGSNELEVMVQSICSGDMGGTLRRIAERIGWALERDCFTAELGRDDAGLVGCERIEVLGSGVHCAEIPGRTRVGEEVTDDGDVREVCRVEQIAVLDSEVSARPGWYYDDFSERAVQMCGVGEQRLAYTAGAAPIPGTSTRFECALTAYAESWNIGGPCPAPGLGCAAGEVIGDRTCFSARVCDPVTDTLYMPCADDDDCAWLGACGTDGRCTTEECRS